MMHLKKFFYPLLLALTLLTASVVSALAVTDHAFNYTITAVGTEDVTTYPDQSFNWTVTTTGTETWTESVQLGSRYVSVYAYKQTATYYLDAPAGSTINGWDYTVHSSSYDGKDIGTYIDTANNRLVIRVYSGGYGYWWCCGGYDYWGHCRHWCYRRVYGHYSATYRIYGNRTRTATVTSTQSGSGTVNATEGTKTVGTFSLAPPPPQHGGTVTVDGRTITDDNPNVTTWMVIGATGQVYASTDYSETVTQPWSATESGSDLVNATEGDKYITTSTLVAPNGDTSWTVTDDSSRVDTWMDGNALYASVIVTPPTADANGPYEGYEGTPITFDGTGSSDPDGTIVSHEWDLDGDGEYDDATGPTPSWTWDDDYAGNIGLKVTDDDGATGTDATTVAISNVAPTVDAGPDQLAKEGHTVSPDPATFSDPGVDDTHTANIDWGDSTVEAGAVSESDGSGTVSGSHVYADDGIYTVTVTVCDDDSDCSGDSLTVTVNNVAPTATFNAPPAVDEGSDINLSLTDPFDPSSADTAAGFEYAFDCGDGTGYGSFSSDNSAVCPTSDNGTRTVKGKIRDEDGGETEYSATVEVNNVPPAVTASPTSQNVQYSDYIADVTFTATDVAADSMSAATSWSVDSSGFTPGPPSSLALTDGDCSVSDGTNTCTWTLSGIANVAAGTYTVRVTVTDDDGGQADADIVIIVEPEDAAVTFDDGNPVAVRVAEPSGNSGPFCLTVYVSETQPDQPFDSSAPGNIGLAVVSMSLVPVGPGGSVAGTCVPGTVDGSGYDARLPVTCSFDNVEVNAYTAQVTVSGGYYTGAAEDVLTVYDPSLGFATGGGWFYWPRTGERTNFGFTMKYNKKGEKVKGNLLLIRHLPDGSIYRVKSNALYGLALGESLDPAFGWASFSGKATYLEPGWPEPEGNYEFLVYVEDHNEPGTGVDQFWIEVKDKDRAVVLVMSMDREATENTVALQGGNIAVPHGGSGGG